MVLGAKPFVASWMYLQLTLWEENGSNKSHTGLQFPFISRITGANLSKACMLLSLCTMYVHWNAGIWGCCTAAHSAGAPRLMLKQWGCSHEPDAAEQWCSSASSELISLAERQDRFARADCKDRAAIVPGTWASLPGGIWNCCQCWEYCTDLNECQLTLFIKSVVSNTHVQGCI